MTHWLLDWYDTCIEHITYDRFTCSVQHLDLGCIVRRIETRNMESGDGQRPTTKRDDYIEWSDYFMAIAFLSAQRSKDPRTQVGACIVNIENKIVGIGYNGMPNGCHDDVMPWGKESDDILETKQLYVCHAELNAVLNKNTSDVKGCRIYVALFPCNECAKVIIQSGITEVIYYSDKYALKPTFVASKRMFELASVKFYQYRPKFKQIVIDFESIEKTVSASFDTNSLSRDINSLSRDINSLSCDINSVSRDVNSNECEGCVTKSVLCADTKNSDHVAVT